MERESMAPEGLARVEAILARVRQQNEDLATAREPRFHFPISPISSELEAAAFEDSKQ